MAKTIKDNKKHTKRFKSVQEIIDFLAPVNSNNFSKNYDRPGFCNTSYNDALTLLQSGWSAGSHDINIACEAIKTNLHDIAAPEYCHDKTGLFIDIGAYMDGMPDCFVDVSFTPVSKPVCKILANITSGYLITQTEIINRGAAILACIDSLYNTHEIALSFVCTVMNAKGHDIEIYIDIDMSNGYSRDLIGFIACHPAMLRRICFGVMEQTSGINFLANYGVCKEIEKHGADIYFPFMATDDYHNIASAAAAVQKIINKMEVK